MSLQILDDISNIGIKDLFDAYASINQQKIARGVVESQNYVDKIKAEAELYNARALNAGGQIVDTLGSNKLITFAVIAGLGFVAYKLLK
jgi:hypothetical protein